MADGAAVWTVLLLAMVSANLPFVNERILLLGPLRQPKAVVWRLIELAFYGGLVIGVGRWLESRAGQAQPQGWQFYAVMACVFLTLAFPGFVWRYLRRRSRT